MTGVGDADLGVAAAELRGALADSAPPLDVLERRAARFGRRRRIARAASAIVAVGAVVAATVAVAGHHDTGRVMVTGPVVTNTGRPPGPMCDTASLAITAGPADVGGPQIGAPLMLKNVSSRSCRLDGALGVQLLDATGTVAFAATPDPGEVPTDVALAPGGTATASIAWTLYGFNGAKPMCPEKDEIAITALSIKLPGATTRARVATPAPRPSICPNDSPSVSAVEAPLGAPGPVLDGPGRGRGA